MNGESGHFEKVTYNPKASFVPTDSAQGAPVEGGSDAAPRQDYRRPNYNNQNSYNSYGNNRRVVTTTTVKADTTIITTARVATTTTAREVTITTTVREATTTIVRVQVSTARADSVSLHVQNRLSTMCLKWIRTRKYA